MALATLKPRLTSASLTRTPVLQAKAGATEMERGRAWMAKRARVAQRHGYRCANCGAVWVSGRDHIDHIVPREQGGSNDESNLQPLCDVPCHKAKSDAEAKARAKGY
jgi:5-methylcytosine-specific restriction protein A